MKYFKLFEEFVNEAVSMSRDNLMSTLESKYKIKTVRKSEDFDGSKDGIWIAGDNSETMPNGKDLIFDYYNKTAKYPTGINKDIKQFIEKSGWRTSWNDPGTLMLWPNK